MNDDDGWAAIDAQRSRVAALLDGLADDEWRRPSLCDGWTVRDVAGHLTLQQLTLGQAVRGMLRHPGGVTRLTREMARAKSALPTADLVAEIRGMVGSRRHNVGVSFRETLVDIVVHGFDIAVPLDRPLETDAGAMVAVADRVWQLGWPFHARKRLRGLRIASSTVEWARGDGPEVRGPIEAVVLLLTGRDAGLGRLTGPGVEALRRQ